MVRGARTLSAVLKGKTLDDGELEMQSVLGSLPHHLLPRSRRQQKAPLPHSPTFAPITRSLGKDCSLSSRPVPAKVPLKITAGSSKLDRNFIAVAIGMSHGALETQSLHGVWDRLGQLRNASMRFCATATIATSHPVPIGASIAVDL